MSDVTCASCGHVNGPGARFCSSCGTALGASSDQTTVSFTPAEAAEVTEAAEAMSSGELPPGEAALVVTRGPKRGSRIALDQDLTTAGRHPDSDVFFDDITVSRRHVEIRRADGRYVVRDVGSLNGTYVNQERIEERELVHGDVLQVGKYKLAFLAPGEAGEIGDGDA